MDVGGLMAVQEEGRWGNGATVRWPSRSVGEVVDQCGCSPLSAVGALIPSVTFSNR